MGNLTPDMDSGGLFGNVAPAGGLFGAAPPVANASAEAADDGDAGETLEEDCSAEFVPLVQLSQLTGTTRRKQRRKFRCSLGSHCAVRAAKVARLTRNNAVHTVSRPRRLRKDVVPDINPGRI